MSTYVNRIVEVRHEILDGCFYKKEQIEALELKEGQTYRSWENGRKFWRVVLEDDKPILKEIDAPDYRWDIADWWTRKTIENHSDNDDYYEAVDNKNNHKVELLRHISYIDNGGSIRDKYLSTWYDFGLSDRGWPNDISGESKKDGENDYCYHKTYALLSELKAILEKEKLKLEQQIKEKFNKEELVKINQKLDALLNKEEFVSQDKDESDDEGFYDEDDDLSIDIEILAEEISKIESISYTAFGYHNENEIRVLYYFC